MLSTALVESKSEQLISLTTTRVAIFPYKCMYIHAFRSPLSLIILASTSDGFVMQMSQRKRLPESITSPTISETGVVRARRRLQASHFIRFFLTNLRLLKSDQSANLQIHTSRQIHPSGMAEVNE